MNIAIRLKSTVGLKAGFCVLLLGGFVAFEPGAISRAARLTAKNPALVSQEAASRKPTPTAGDAAAGRQIYAANCQACHQANRAGVPPVFPSLVGVVTRLGADHVKEKIMNGVPAAKPAMPAYADKLSEEDLNNLLEYLSTAKD